MDVRRREGMPQAGMTANERIALAFGLELLPVVGMLAVMENKNLAWVGAVLVLLSGTGWVLMRRYQLAALLAITRVLLVVVPFVLVGLYMVNRCDESCTWHESFGSAWPLWIAALFAQPILSALALVAHEWRTAPA